MRRQGTQGRRRCADEPDRRGQLPANLGRVRVQVHQPGAGRQPRMADRRERVEHPGADGEYEVAAIEHGRVLAVQAEEPRIGGRERQIRQVGEVGADQRRHQPVGQRPQLRNATTCLAAHHHGPAGGGERGGGGRADGLVRHRPAAGVARPPGPQRAVGHGRVRRVRRHRAAQEVLRHGQVGRPGRDGHRRVQGPPQVRTEFGRAEGLVRPFGERPDHLWQVWMRAEPVSAQHGAVFVARGHHNRRAIPVGVFDLV